MDAANKLVKAVGELRTWPGAKDAYVTVFVQDGTEETANKISDCLKCQSKTKELSNTRKATVLSPFKQLEIVVLHGKREADKGNPRWCKGSIPL